MINEFQKPYSITQEELNLRFDYSEGKITLQQFNRRYKKLKKLGLVIRNGKKVKE